MKGVYPSRRSITDEEIDAIAELDGAIGIMCAPNFLAGRLFVDSRVFCDHVDYVVERVGHRHVCFGSDFDGWIPLFSDQKDCRDFVKITDELLRRGYSEEQLSLFLCGNAQRVIEAAWRAGELNRERSTPRAEEERGR